MSSEFTWSSSCCSNTKQTYLVMYRYFESLKLSLFALSCTGTGIMQHRVDSQGDSADTGRNETVRNRALLSRYEPVKNSITHACTGPVPVHLRLQYLLLLKPGAIIHDTTLYIQYHTVQFEEAARTDVQQYRYSYTLRPCYLLVYITVLYASHVTIFKLFNTHPSKESATMRSRILSLLPAILSSLSLLGSAFVPVPVPSRIGQLIVAPSSTTTTFPLAGFYVNPSLKNRLPAPLQRKRKSVASVQTMGLFGLGTLEILVILVGIGVVLGPEKIMEMVRSSGDTANEYKEELSKIPDEFKKGLEEGETEARSRKAKVIKKVVVAKDDDAAV